IFATSIVHLTSGTTNSWPNDAPCSTTTPESTAAPCSNHFLHTDRQCCPSRTSHAPPCKGAGQLQISRLLRTSFSRGSSHPRCTFMSTNATHSSLRLHTDVT